MNKALVITITNGLAIGLNYTIPLELEHYTYFQVHTTPSIMLLPSEHKMPTGGKSAKPTLLTLPAELRNRIFALAVVRDERVSLTRTTAKRIRTQTTSVPAPPPIARVCRQTRNEVLPIYYGGNTLWLDRNNKNPMEWCEKLVSYLPEAMKLMRSIVLHKTIHASRLQRTSNEKLPLDIKLSLDQNDQVKISFPPSVGAICTCNMERDAQLWARAAVAEGISPVVKYAQRMHSLSDVWNYPLAGTRKRSKECKCGIQGENADESGSLVD